jgi:hypothetical protein
MICRMMHNYDLYESNLQKTVFDFCQIRHVNTFANIFPQHGSIVTDQQMFHLVSFSLLSELSPTTYLMSKVHHAFLICGLILVRSAILTGLPLSILFLAAIPVRIAKAPSRKPAACR